MSKKINELASKLIIDMEYDCNENDKCDTNCDGCKFNVMDALAVAKYVIKKTKKD